MHTSRPARPLLRSLAGALLLTATAAGALVLGTAPAASADEAVLVPPAVSVLAPPLVSVSVAVTAPAPVPPLVFGLDSTIWG